MMMIILYIQILIVKPFILIFLFLSFIKIYSQILMIFISLYQFFYFILSFIVSNVYIYQLTMLKMLSKSILSLLINKLVIIILLFENLSLLSHL